MAKIIVTVAGQVRGVNAQEAFGFTADEGTLTNTWGLQPGTALVSWVKAATDGRVILPLAALTIEIGGHVFYGICEEAVQVTSHDGRTLTQRFLDSRALLQYDLIYAQFNLRDARMVNGQYQVRYRHLLPGNYNARRYTFTDAPYFCSEILNFCFGAATVETPWVRFYIPALNQPVYDVDCDGGRKLGTLVAELSARCGTTFTLQPRPGIADRYRLVWVVKGLGAIPTFPANSTARRLGLSVSDNPTRLRILGERNQYQVLDVAMQPDWVAGHEDGAVDFENFADDLFRYEALPGAFGAIPAGTLYNAIPGDTDQHIGRQLAQARANVITLAEYATLRDTRWGDGDLFRDTRRAQGQSRMQMPVASYCRLLVFRAFRPPADFSFTNYAGQTMPLIGMELLDRGLTDIEHDATTGVMLALPDQQACGNGYAIAKGYGASLEGLRMLHPETFDLDQWRNSQNLWQAVPFQLDDSGEDGKFIVFDQPMIVSADLLSLPAIGGGYPVMKAQPTVTVPPVRMALVVAGERFSWITGSGTKDEVENVPALAGQFLVGPGGLTELSYADGETAADKAVALAATLLNRQFYLTAGGYLVQGSNATQLTSQIDRVTVTLNAGGLSEAVDFANARSRNVGNQGAVQVELAPEFERRAQLQPLFPGEREQRETARQLRLQASALRHNPALARLLSDTFHLLTGLGEPPRTHFLNPVAVAGSSLVTLPVGTPLWRPAAARTVGVPGVAGLVDPVFAGVTVVEGELLDGPVRATLLGRGGVILARVRGPVAVNDSVGRLDTGGEPNADVLVQGGSPVVGTAQAGITDDSTRLIPVRVAGGVSGWRWAPIREYDSDEQNYAVDEVVVVSPTNADAVANNCVAGLYVCLKPGTWADAGLTIQYPVWPPAALDPDHADNFWWLISFYPTRMTYCLDGEDTDYFVNAQPVPPEV